MLVIGNDCVADEVIQRIAVKAIAVSDGRVLMLRPTGRDDLKFPGGGVEPGEDDASALARELQEETGYRLVSIRALHEGQPARRKVPRSPSSRHSAGSPVVRQQLSTHSSQRRLPRKCRMSLTRLARRAQDVPMQGGVLEK